MNSEETIVLKPTDALVADISTPPEDQHFDSDPDIAANNVELRIGRGPLLIDLSEKSRAIGQPLGQELAYLEERFRVLLLTTSMSILKTPGSRNVSQLQYSLDFDERTELAILDLLPKAEIIESAKLSLGTRSVVQAGVNAEGKISVVLPTAAVQAQARVETDNHAGILADFNYTIYAIRTQAMGQYSKTAIWNFSNEGKPLVGDFVFVTTILLDKFVDTRLKYSVKAVATLKRFGLFPEVRKSDWIPQQLELQRFRT